MTEARTASLIVTDADAGERADVVLGRKIPGLSRRRARSLALAGKLRIDGRRQPPSTRVSVGARLELELDEHPPNEHEQAELEIVAETERFIYVCKPAGMHTIALTPTQPGVLATVVAARFPECAEASPDPREGGAVHRLDRPTSGVVAFARSREVWLAAREAFAAEQVAKHYLAASVGGSSTKWPPDLPEGALHGWIEPYRSLPRFAGPSRDSTNPLERAPELARWLHALVGAGALIDAPAVRIRAPLGNDGPTRSRVSLDGRRATTLVLPLARIEDRQLSYLALETGRRHQARIHLAWIGWPIRGDGNYGSASTSDDSPTAIGLHAVALDLSAAFPAERLVLAAPPPGFWP